ncbi:MAG: hypothetical protein R3293_03000 [Candidatus Promineifilaceae bacterium]|nr:hypothetical protein [Candidatus Promineifilaceae bacterium]
MNWRRWFRNLTILLLALLILVLLAPEWPTFTDEQYRLREIVQLREFDYLVWESAALLNKGEAVLSGGHRYLDEESRKEIVVEYLELTREARLLESELNRLYVDPEVLDPDLASKPLQAQIREIRQELKTKQLLAEAVVQDQVATILREEGFKILENTWPPVMMHVTPLPSLLVVSPRDHIVKKYEVSLVNGLSTPEKDEIETAVFDHLDHSALVVPLGGIGTYPAMISETSDINRLAEVTSHEWAHHWLTLQPLGFNYAFDPDVRIINETVASLIDRELGQKVVERYYPEYLPVETATETPVPENPDAFNFNKELAATRIRAEELLSQGKIEEAEAYMAGRRLDFVDAGYGIRKLNQAYFAFYGAYAAEPGGAQGGNPIGPMLRDIRENSLSIREFLDTVSSITSFNELQEIHNRINSEKETIS